jgi:transcriptional regulator with XRE-family HTH domain
MDKINFGKELIKVRKTRGLTQAEIAEKCNVTIRTIQRIESGTVKPRSSTIKIISKFLEVDFFEVSNKNSTLKNHPISLSLKDFFNFKTNAIKKSSILAISFLFLAFTCIYLMNIKAQSNSPEKEQKSGLKSLEKKGDFSKDYDEFEIDGDFVFVAKNNKRGLISLGGKTIIPCDFDAFEIENNFVFTLNENKRGLMNLDGKTIIPCIYDSFEVEDDFVFTLNGNKRGLMNLYGKVIIPCDFDNVKIEGAFAMVTKNGKTKRIKI